MGATWSEILGHIRLISPDIYATINGPAELSEIRRLEETVGVELPQAFRDYLSTMNGQRNTEEATRDRNKEIPFLGYNPFLSVTGVLETWSMMNGLFPNDTELLDWVEEDKIKPFNWRRHWVPFTEYEGGDYLILDCDPGINGTYGQVFAWNSGMDYSDVIADSFEAFSDGLLLRLSGKCFKIDEFGAIEFDDYYI